jgi:hypothetical protein
MPSIFKIASVFVLSILSIILLTGNAQATSIQSLPNLQDVTFIEMTGTAHEHTVAYNNTVLTSRLPDPMYYSYYSTYHSLPQPYDFVGANAYNAWNELANFSECYDVFYSDKLGTFDTNGAYLTIEAVWPRYQGYPNNHYGTLDTGVVGGGLNIAAVYLTFQDSSKVYADITTSYVAFGDNKVEGSYGWATDASESTATTMGNTIQPGHPDRLRITVGFSSPTAVPGPATILLLAPGLLAIWRFRGKFRK